MISQEKKDRRVLVLNKAWMPLGITSAEDAIKRLCRNTSGIQSIASTGRPCTWDEWIELSNEEYFEDQQYFNSPSSSFPIPSIILTESPVFKKNTNRKVTIMDLMEYFDNRCQICTKRFRKSQLTIDHIVPQSKGGGHEPSNLTLACKTCNNKKADIYPFVKYDGGKLIGFEFSSLITIPDVKDEWKPFIVVK